MAKCERCGRKGFFLLVDEHGLCRNCQKEVLKSLTAQVESRDIERETLAAQPPLSPESMKGMERRYHYPDVNIVVSWEYCGRYGKSCESIGMKRGDPVRLVCETDKENNDKDAVAVYWNKERIGYMKGNRLRDMVHQWKSAKRPIFCAVSQVGGEYNLFLEFAFYMTPKRRKKAEGSSVKRKEQTATENSLRTLEYVERCEASFIAFDVETTGLSRENDRIIELSAVKFEDFEPVGIFTSRINPHIPISEAASKVNKLTDEELQDAPEEEKVLKAFCDFVGEEVLSGVVVVVAHNAPFDVAFLLNAFCRLGIKASILVDDTLKLSKSFLPDLKNYKLKTVARALDIKQKRAHRAEDDALVCGEIFVHLLNEVKQRQLDKLDAISPLEKDTCQWIKATLQDAGCETKYLSFNVSTYLSVNCYGQVMRLKPRARKPYALIDKQYSVPDTMQTAPATKSEGEEYVRVFFQRPENLEPIKDAIVKQYQKVSRETDKRLAAEPSRMKELADIIDRQVCI